jgi:tetrahydromethanopterin S-methyltransferase subunit D
MAKKRQAVRRKKQGRGWPATLIVLGVIGVVMGAIFVIEGAMKYYYLRDAMRQEKITLFFIPNAPKDKIIDSAQEALLAGDTIRMHRRTIAPTYNDLLGGKKYDPTNPKHLTYTQALNLEQYLYLAFMGFGVTQIVIVSGIFMVIMGVAIGGTGITLYKR